MFDSLPEEAVISIFQFLNPFENISCRRVCHDWRMRLTGCGHITFKKVSSSSCRGMLAEMRNSIRQVYLKGNTDRSKGSIKRSLQRTRGHLNQPAVLPDPPGSILQPVVEFCPTKNNGLALRMERNLDDACLRSLDVAQSLYQSVEMRQQAPPRIGIPLLRRVNQRHLMKRIVCAVDLSGLRRLERLSLRGCGSLRNLRLPPSIVALDASGCNELVHITSPFGLRERFEALNLSGCRKLVPHGKDCLFGDSMTHAMQYIRELDLSSTINLPKPLLAVLLKSTTVLESVSLRYIATDDILLGLSSSKSVFASLKLIDASFSSDLTDRSVETLVNEAHHLDRLNLRACGSVSAACYNGVPVVLEQRRNKPNGSERITLQLEGNITSRRKRKGDNIFFFTGSNKLTRNDRTPSTS